MSIFNEHISMSIFRFQSHGHIWVYGINTSGRGLSFIVRIVMIQNVL